MNRLAINRTREDLRLVNIKGYFCLDHVECVNARVLKHIHAIPIYPSNSLRLDGWQKNIIRFSRSLPVHRRRLALTISINAAV